jgi:Zn-dependent metalloprotease
LYDKNFAIASIFISEKDFFGLSDNDEMKLLQKDSLGKAFVRYKYQQYYKNLKVEGATIFVFEKDGKLIRASGKLAQDLSLTISPTKTEEQGLSTAKMNVATELGIEPASINLYKAGELVWCEVNLPDFNPENFVLAWKFELYDSTFTKPQIIFIDASSGVKIKSFPLSYKCYPGVGQTTWNGLQSIHAEWNS